MRGFILSASLVGSIVLGPNTPLHFADGYLLNLRPQPLATGVIPHVASPSDDVIVINVNKPHIPQSTSPIYPQIAFNHQDSNRGAMISQSLSTILRPSDLFNNAQQQGRNSPLYRPTVLASELTHIPTAAEEEKQKQKAITKEEMLLEDIKAVIKKHYGQEKGVNVTVETHLEKDLELDSLAKMEILLDIEKTHNVEIPEEKASNLETVGHVYDEVRNLKWPAN